MKTFSFDFRFSVFVCLFVREAEKSKQMLQKLFSVLILTALLEGVIGKFNSSNKEQRKPIIVISLGLLISDHNNR